MEGKVGQLSKMSELIEEKTQLQKELESMTELMSKKDVEIALLKAQLVKAQTEGPGTEELAAMIKNDELSAKVNELNAKLLHSHEDANTRLNLVLLFLGKPSSSSSLIILPSPQKVLFVDPPCYQCLSDLFKRFSFWFKL